VHRFVKLLVSHRLHHLVQRGRRDQTLADFLSEAHIQIHGIKLNQPNWSHDSHSLALTARDPAGGMLHVMINGYWEPLAFEVPRSTEAGRWRRWIDTSRASPDDICARNEAALIAGSTYLVQPRSIVCLLAQPPAGRTFSARIASLRLSAANITHALRSGDRFGNWSKKQLLSDLRSWQRGPQIASA
jgi:isoamylase